MASSSGPGTPKSILLNPWYDFVVPFENIATNTNVNLTVNDVINEARIQNDIFANFFGAFTSPDDYTFNIPFEMQIRGFEIWGVVGGQVAVTEFNCTTFNQTNYAQGTNITFTTGLDAHTVLPGLTSDIQGLGLSTSAPRTQQSSPGVQNFTVTARSNAVDGIVNQWYDAGTNASRPCISEILPDRNKQIMGFVALRYADPGATTDITDNSMPIPNRKYLNIQATTSGSNSNDTLPILYIYLSIRSGRPIHLTAATPSSEIETFCALIDLDELHNCTYEIKQKVFAAYQKNKELLLMQCDGVANPNKVANLCKLIINIERETAGKDSPSKTCSYRTGSKIWTNWTKIKTYWTEAQVASKARL